MFHLEVRPIYGSRDTPAMPTPHRIALEATVDRRRFLTGAATTGGAAAVGALAGAGAATASPADRTALALPVPSQPASFGRAGRDFPKVGGDYGNQNHS